MSTNHSSYLGLQLPVGEGSGTSAGDSNSNRNGVLSRRSLLRGAVASAGIAAAATWERGLVGAPSQNGPVSPKDKIKITKLETFLVKPRWLFLKVHTDAGIVGLGEPILEGRAKTCATAIEEIAPYLIGKDPRQVVHHWQAIYRHAFYRCAPVMTSALSGIDIPLA